VDAQSGHDGLLRARLLASAPQQGGRGRRRRTTGTLRIKRARAARVSKRGARSARLAVRACWFLGCATRAAAPPTYVSARMSETHACACEGRRGRYALARRAWELSTPRCAASRQFAGTSYILRATTMLSYEHNCGTKRRHPPYKRRAHARSVRARVAAGVHLVARTGGFSRRRKSPTRYSEPVTCAQRVRLNITRGCARARARCAKCAPRLARAPRVTRARDGAATSAWRR
jgi:hypothetical protein